MLSNKLECKWEHSQPTIPVISQDGVSFGNQIALMVIDCTPLVGNFFDGFIDLASEFNIPIKYVPLFADDSAQEWFFSYFQQELTRRFQTHDFKIRNVERWCEFSTFPPKSGLKLYLIDVAT